MNVISYYVVVDFGGVRAQVSDTSAIEQGDLLLVPDYVYYAISLYKIHECSRTVIGFKRTGLLI